MAACNNADLHGPGGKPAGDPTELALLELAAGCGVDVSLAGRQTRRRQLFRFDPRLKLMTTVDEQDGGLVVNTKGAPEEVLARVTRIHRGGRDVPITAADRDEATLVMTDYARRGLRVLAVARRVLPAGSAGPAPPGRRTGSVPDRASGHARPAALARSPRRSPRCTGPASASTWSPAITGSPPPRSPAALASAPAPAG